MPELVECRNCSHQVSKEAKNCPNCEEIYPSWTEEEYQKTWYDKLKERFNEYKRSILSVNWNSVWNTKFSLDIFKLLLILLLFVVFQCLILSVGFIVITKSNK